MAGKPAVLDIAYRYLADNGAQIEFWMHLHVAVNIPVFSG